MSPPFDKKPNREVESKKLDPMQRFLCSDYYFEQMNPSIRDNFNYEQSKEIKSVLKRAIRVPSKKVVNIEVTFWFFKRFYLVFYLGFDKRKRVNMTNLGSLSGSIKCLLHCFITLLIWSSTLFVMCSVIYYAKSTLGIDLFPDQHLQDVLLNRLNE